MKISLCLILLVTIFPSLALGSAPPESCSQEQHVQWIETCLFVIADVDFTHRDDFTHSEHSEGPRDPWSIVPYNCAFWEEDALLPEFTSACRARLEGLSKIGEHLWQAQPDLLNRLSACNWTAHEQWLGACLKPIDRLKKFGGTRRDVLRYFDLRKTGMPEKLTSRQCPFVMVNVWFATAADVAESSDVIRDISPYIDYPNGGCPDSTTAPGPPDA
jgi:hypothetical protein